MRFPENPNDPDFSLPPVPGSPGYDIWPDGGHLPSGELALGPPPGSGMAPEVEEPAAFSPVATDFAQEADYSIPGFSSEDRTRLGNWLQQQVRRFEQATSTRRDNAKEWRDAADNYPRGDAPRDWMADVRAPFTSIACAQHTMRLNAAILEPDPPMAVVAKEPEALEAVEAIEEAMKSLMSEAEWDLAARELHVQLPVDCPAAVHVEWERRWENVPVFHTGVDAEEAEDAAGVYMRAGADAEQAYLAAAGADPLTLQVPVRFGHEEQIVADGIRFTVVGPEDLVFFPATARHERDLWGIGQRVMLSGAELAEGAKRGRYDQETVDRILAGPSDALPEGRQDALDLIGFDPDQAGTDDEGLGDGSLYRAYQAVELCILADLDRDGLQEKYLVTVLDSGELPRAQYLPYEHNQFPYVLFPYLDRPGERVIGASIAERNAGMQDAADSLLNSLLDLVGIASSQLGNFLYDDRSGYDPEAQTQEPGQPIRVENVDVGIRPMDWVRDIVTGIGATMEALNLVKLYSELITATSNPALGRETDQSRTLGEVSIVMEQSAQIFGDYSVAVALRWAKVWDQARWLYARYGATEEAGEQVVRYRKSASGGMSEFATIPTQVLTAKVDLVPAGLKQFGDAQTKLQTAQFINEEFKANPLTMSIPEVLLESLDKLIQAARWAGREKVIPLIEQQIEQMRMAAEQAALQAQADAEMQAGMMQEQQGMASEAAQAQADRDSQAFEQQLVGTDLSQLNQLADLDQKLAQSPGAPGRIQPKTRAGK